MDNMKSVITALLDAKSELKTWESVGDKYGVSKATVYDICMKGHVPKDKSIRYKLGIVNDKKRYPVWCISRAEQLLVRDYRDFWRDYEEAE